MVKPISDQALQFRVRARRRILGAIVLVVALVVLLPMVLDTQPEQKGDEVAINIPAPDKAPPFNPPLKPAAEKNTPPMDARRAPVGESANAVSKSTASEVKPLDKPAEKPKAEAARPGDAKVADTKSAKFAVQVGVFANPENAEQLETRLKENKIRHYTETLKSPPGAIRVRAGPYASRAEAESALTRMKLAGISGGVVVSE